MREQYLAVIKQWLETTAEFSYDEFGDVVLRKFDDPTEAAESLADALEAARLTPPAAVPAS